ncbi:hypothetical protein [Actinomadura violacea]|uniref:Uncharacterized protein n=1 Tax=Actinomadura violacea TaxID=2819934 RepID=A0ABS3RY91_9ACTN|nr:hypothetical protein [Actinomadura violacea]MBO2461729.1 hypothetical protein [Actinomadura violacea]
MSDLSETHPYEVQRRDERGAWHWTDAYEGRGEAMDACKADERVVNAVTDRIIYPAVTETLALLAAQQPDPCSAHYRRAQDAVAACDGDTARAALTYLLAAHMDRTTTRGEQP